MVRPSEDMVRAVLRARKVAPHVLAGGAEGLISAWRHFVRQVEGGYPMGLDDYCNDLDIRTLIEVSGLSGEVADADREFRSLLIHPHVEVWSSEVPGAFWVRGYPANATGELLEDLKARAGVQA